MRKTLEQYLRGEFRRSGAIDHSLRAEITADGVAFYIHASGRDSDTQCYVVRGNEVGSDPKVTYPDEPSVSDR